MSCAINSLTESLRERLKKCAERHQVIMVCLTESLIFGAATGRKDCCGRLVAMLRLDRPLLTGWAVRPYWNVMLAGVSQLVEILRQWKEESCLQNWASVPIGSTDWQARFFYMQILNRHNVFTDLGEEAGMYQRAGELVKLLNSWHAAPGKDLAELMIDLGQVMADHSFWGQVKNNSCLSLQLWMKLITHWCSFNDWETCLSGCLIVPQFDEH